MCDKHLIPAVGKIALTELRPQHLQRLYADKLAAGLSPRTVQIIHVTIHKALNNAVRTGLLSRNVAEAVDSPKGTHREMRIMNESDIHLFLEMARFTEYYALFYLLLFTGLRRNESLALYWQDIDLLLCELSVIRSMQYLHNVEPEKRISFKEPKTQKSRRLIALSPSTVAVLQEHREAQNKQRQVLGATACYG